MSASVVAVRRRAWWPSLSWQPVDRHGGVTRLAVLGLAAAVALAVFGMPSIESHGPLYQLGIMSPICGGTRAVYYAMQGDLALSLRYNPIGVPLVLGAMAAIVRHLAGTVTGRWLTFRLGARRPAIVVLVVLAVVLEVNQQLNAAFLLSS